MAYLTIFLLILTVNTYSKDYSANYTSRLSASDYLLKDRGKHSDPVFDVYRTVDLGVDLGIGSDCGRISLKNTLKASLKNLLINREYFGEVGRSILAASPMLLTCYFSPTWCSILKHGRITANFLAQMRLDQCSLIDKYTDSRTEDFYIERQKCVHSAIERKDGNMEQAMKECQNGNVHQYDLSNWAGSRYGKKTSSNKLLESSAKWAGFNDSESNKLLDLAKSIVGETIISKGKISINYGTRKVALTPRTYLMSIEKETYNSLCKNLFQKIDAQKDKHSIEKIVTDNDLRTISQNEKERLIDRQTLRSLVYLPLNKRKIACKKLSAAMSLTMFSRKMNRTIDMLTRQSHDPHLPPKWKRKLKEKISKLETSVDRTIKSKKDENKPLNEVLSLINKEGSKYINEFSKKKLVNNADQINSDQIHKIFFDCSDDLMCDGGN